MGYICIIKSTYPVSDPNRETVQTKVLYIANHSTVRLYEKISGLFKYDKFGHNFISPSLNKNKLYPEAMKIYELYGIKFDEYDLKRVISLLTPLHDLDWYYHEIVSFNYESIEYLKGFDEYEL